MTLHIAREVFQDDHLHPTQQQSTMKWSETRMSEASKDKVRTMLMKRVYNMGMKITEDNVCLITEHRNLAKKFRHAQGPAAADVAWSWVAEQESLVS